MAGPHARAGAREQSRPGEITIETTYGKRQVDCALVVKGLAVHRMYNCPDLWVITHIQTGHNFGSAGATFPNSAAAAAAAHEIAEIADWTKGREHLRALNLKGRVAEIVERWT